MSKIFNDDSRPKELPTYDEIMETLTKDPKAQEERINKLKEDIEKQFSSEDEEDEDDDDYEPSDCPLPAMSDEQAFHYRMSVLNMMKEMIMDPKMMDDKKKHDSLVDHFM